MSSITREEWDQMDSDDQYSYMLYVQGQLEGLIKALYIVSPRRNTNVGPQEFKEAKQQIQNVEEWLKDKANTNNV